MKLPRSEVAREGEQFQHRADLFSSILAFAMPMSEKALIARIRRKAVPGRSIVTGIGDDSAVLKIPKGHQALVTTDFSLEGVHFWREWHPPVSRARIERHRGHGRRACRCVPFIGSATEIATEVGGWIYAGFPSFS